MKKIIGTIVSGVVDRPLGSHHPKHTHIIYPINYGYVEGVLAVGFKLRIQNYE